MFCPDCGTKMKRGEVRAVAFDVWRETEYSCLNAECASVWIKTYDTFEQTSSLSKLPAEEPSGEETPASAADADA